MPFHYGLYLQKKQTLSIFNESKTNIMETNNNKKKESIWSTILRVAITILTAIATSLGVQSCI